MDFDFSTETITPEITNLLTIGGTGGVELPLGTTAERPVTGLSNGALRYNTDINLIEGYINSSWTSMATGTTTLTLTGDVTGSGAGTIATTLATVNANVGTFAVQTVNAKGLVTAATTLTGDITSSGAATTLATVNSNVGTFTAATFNGKGLATAASNMTASGDASGTASGANLPLTLATVNANIGQFAVQTVNAKGLVTAATALSATGDATGTSSGASIALTLATVNGAPQTDAFRKITVNGKGLTTATSAVGSADIITALGFTPVNKAGDSMNTNASLTFSGTGTVTGLPLPIAGTDAANKNYVDSAIAGLSWKQAVRVATTVAGTLATSFTNGSSIDGITLVTGDRILIKNQVAQTENGIYIVTAGTPTRSTDADVGTELVGATVYVDQGSTQADSGWTQTTAAPITIGSSNIVWAQFSGSGSYTAGTGLTLTGNQFSLTTPVTAVLGGTGQTVYAVGDILTANTTTTLSRLADVATGNSLISGGVGVVPSWGKIGLTTHITGILPIANGGTNLSALGTANQILGVNAGATGLEYKTTTAGTAISIVNGVGTVTINNTGVTSAVAGTGISVSAATGAVTISNTGVTSVGLSLPSIFTVSGSPVTTTGTLSATLAGQTANTVFAAPSGSAGAPTFRALTYLDLPLVLYKENPSSPVALVASGANSVAIGSGASSTAANGIAIGAGTSANVANIVAIANGNFATAGDAQSIRFVARNITTTATVTDLFIDGTAQRLVLPNNSAWTFNIQVVGRRTDATGGSAMYTFIGGITRDATAATTILQGSSRTTINKTDGPWNANISADTTNGALTISVTGQATKTIRWVATIELTQVTN